MAAWVARDGKKLYDAAVVNLGNLHILPSSTVKLALNSTFKTSFRHAITGGGTSGSFGVPVEKDDKRPALDLGALDSPFSIIWFHLAPASIHPNLRRVSFIFFSALNLPSGALQITSFGFQFLLYSPHEQLWNLLLQYLHMAEERQMDLVEVLSFLFMLSTMELGREYSTEHLSETQKAMLEDLRDYGLIWQRKASRRMSMSIRL
ncbi:hypothetical protein CCMSSC00406_0008743 [Pleurotus cornucopiae]|uniref:Uncharacterized protein n=1 Tax=Pleurotus cornucopiae TaxID=5321 RepID=A0ACB7J5G6_PLECO|nr:hypothetical protein CCMSSC00406_0008743 [Pleurotus cornucopiae]